MALRSRQPHVRQRFFAPQCAHYPRRTRRQRFIMPALASLRMRTQRLGRHFGSLDKARRPVTKNRLRPVGCKSHSRRKHRTSPRNSVNRIANFEIRAPQMMHVARNPRTLGRRGLALRLPASGRRGNRNDLSSRNWTKRREAFRIFGRSPDHAEVQVHRGADRVPPELGGGPCWTCVASTA